MNQAYRVDVLKLENPATTINLLDGQSLPLEAFAFDKASFQVLLPQKRCAQGQFVEFELVLKGEKRPKKKVSGSAKVVEVSAFNLKLVSVKFELKETQISIWQDFVEKLVEKQEETASLFEKVRGW